MKLQSLAVLLLCLSPIALSLLTSSLRPAPRVSSRVAADSFSGDEELPIPCAGEEPWGCWSQSDHGMSLELLVDDGTPAKAVQCRVQVGFLDVRVSDEPILSGRLAQQMRFSELTWELDKRADGQAVLRIDLPKQETRAADASGDDLALFASLKVDGGAATAQGLVTL